MTSAATASTSSRLPDRRTAVVTGAGGPAGIGRVTAQVLAENGWAVALVDINADGLSAVEAELRGAGHEDLLAVPADIASESSVNEAFDRIDGALPPVVGLVNLAGIACPTPLHECELKEFERVMAVNVTGSFLMLEGGRRPDDPAGRRPDRQHLLDHRLRRGRDLLQGRLRHGEGRRDRNVPRGCPGARAVRDHRERPRARADRHRDHGRPAHRRAQGVDVRRHSRSAGSASPRRSPPPWRSCSPTAAAT